MSKVSKYANTHTAITTGYTNPSNAYATGDSAYATAMPGSKNSEVAAYWGFPAFTTSDIPDGSTINSVTVKHVFKVSTNASVAEEYIQLYLGTTSQGTEQVNVKEPLTDTELSNAVTSVITLSNLRTADFVRARTRSRRGNSNTSVTFSIDYVLIEVDFTEPGSNFQKNVDDSVTCGDVTTLFQEHVRSLADSVNASDSKSDLFSFKRTIEDTVIPSDNESNVSSFQRLLSDSVILSDTHNESFLIQLNLFDSVNPADSLINKVGKLFTDSVSVSDLISTQNNFVREISDSVTSSETIEKHFALFRSLFDSVTSSDIKTESKMIMRSFSDSVETSDTTVVMSSNSMAGRIALVVQRIATEIKSVWYALTGKADANHNHDAAYLGKTAKAADSDKLDGIDSTGFSLSNHNHSGDYEPIITTKSAGFLKWTGSEWSFDPATYLTAITKAMVEAVLTGTITSHNHSGVYEPVFAKSTGYLRWTGSTWEFKNETYLTGITKAMVEAVLTGTITSHNHSGTYEPALTANQRSAITGANNPSASNVFATMADVAAAGGDDKTVKASSSDVSPGFLDAKVDNVTIEISGNKLQVKANVFASYTHNHNGVYETLITKSTGYLRWNGTAWEFKNETYALSSHNHDSVYEPLITKSTGYLKWTGSVWTFLNETYLTGITKAMVEGVLTGAITSHTHAYIPTSHTVNNITNGTGFLKNNGSGSWSWDNSTYLTAITKALVEAVLTGTITSHNHSGTYEPALTANQRSAITGANNPSASNVFATMADVAAAGGDDKTVKASSSDVSPGFLDAKVDNVTIEISGNKLQVKANVFASYTHNHNGVYETLITKSTGYLRWNGTAWEFKNETYALSSHNHDSVYEPLITKSTGYLKWTGSVWTFLNETYLTGITKAMVEGVLTGAITSHTHAYIPTSHTVNNITNGTGFLKNNGSGSWSWDNSTYLTAITKALVEAVLTGTITSHNHSGTYEPAFSKNTAFNKNFGTGSGTVCEGNDSRLSNSRTPSDASVSYAKIAADLTRKQAVSASDIDWNSGGIFTKAMSANTTFTFSNLKLNKTITIVLSGNYVVTLPTYCKRISGTYDGATTNYIQLHCTDAGSGTEEVWFTISKQAT